MRYMQLFSTAILTTLMTSVAFAAAPAQNAATSASATPTPTATTDNNAKVTSGVYIGALLGTGTVSLGNAGNPLLDQNNAWDLAYGFNLGYLFNPHWAAEIGFTSIYAATDPRVADLIGGITSRSNLFDIAVKPIVSLGSGFSVYGKLGLGVQAGRMHEDILFTSATVSQSQAALYAGAGVAYNFTPHFQAMLDFSSSYSSAWDTYNFMGGLGYLF